MKRLIGIILVVALAMPMFAAEKATPEERANRDYSAWLPAQGDWAVGFSLDPITHYLGNLFNGNTNNNLGNLGGEPMMTSKLGAAKPKVSIMGTYMLTNNLGLKANVGLAISVYSQNEYAIDEAARFENPLSNAKVVDKAKQTDTYGSVALGIEYRAGKTRPVQGVFGAGVNYAFGTTTTNCTYGNAITELIQVPDIAIGSYTTRIDYMPQARILSTQTPDMIHILGVYGSVGVEWFVAPKISLGANVNVGVYYEMNPAQASTYEGWNTMAMKTDTYTDLIAPASHGFHFGTDNIGANLYVNFFF